MTFLEGRNHMPFTSSKPKLAAYGNVVPRKKKKEEKKKKAMY